ncbi:hypothetical protein G6F60_014546 [Rhizopus arrhizus]|nr:hypothetical protein G6F60_014546 [Rhizopus arrhizus]
MAFVAAFVAAALASRWQPSRKTAMDSRQALAAGIAVALAAAGWPLSRVDWSSPTGDLLNVRLVQGNIEQSQKFDPALLEQSLVRHLEMTALPPAAGAPAPRVNPTAALPGGLLAGART